MTDVHSNSTSSLIIGLVVVLLLPWIGALNGGSHYLNGSDDTNTFLNILSSKGLFGMVMSFTYKYSLIVLALVTVSEILNLNKTESEFLKGIGLFALATLNLSAIPLAFMYTASNPPKVSLLLFGVSASAILAINIYTFLTGESSSAVR